jgi:hypothetical protein
VKNKVLLKMVKILNIVNGDAVIPLMKTANINGDFLPWRDFLHEGPVPQNFSLEKLSKIRAHFIHEQGFGKLNELLENFQERDNILKNHDKYIKIVLWFEHDLYDQLQLLQTLAWLSKNLSRTTVLSLICTENYLGESSPSQIVQLLQYEERVTPEHFRLAEKAWSAFCEPSPKNWFKLLHKDTSVLPFLQDSIKRLLEEFPNTKNGLSRTEHQALLIIARGESKPRKIFTKYQNYEKRKFMGDVIFWKVLDDFIDHKLIKSRENGQDLTLTPLGKKVLNGEKNWLQIKPINRWKGGVNLKPTNLWCWNIQKKNIRKYYFSTVLSSLVAIKQ